MRIMWPVFIHVHNLTFSKSSIGSYRRDSVDTFSLMRKTCITSLYHTGTCIFSLTHHKANSLVVLFTF